MTHEDRTALAYRAQLIVDNLKNCTSGADIHEVNSMRHTAQMLHAAAQDGFPIDEHGLRLMLERLESRLVSYFQKKFYNARFRS